MFLVVPNYLIDLTIFLTSSISLHEILIISKRAKSTVRVLQPEIFLWSSASTANAITVNPSHIKALLNNGISIFYINGKPVFSNGLKSLPRSAPDCTFLDSWAFIVSG